MNNLKENLNQMIDCFKINFKSAVKYFEKSLKILHSHLKSAEPAKELKIEECAVIFNLGEVFEELGYLEKSEKSYLEAYEKYLEIS